MIKLPKEVNNIVKVLEKGGHQAYTVGSCVRDSIMGVAPLDWDVVTIAKPEEMKEALKAEMEKASQRSKTIGDDLLRLDYTEEKFDEEGESLGFEGIVVDVLAIDGTIEEYLSIQDFTINAMADNPDKPFLDPYEGREDIKKKLIKTIEDADKSFKEEPIRMMRAVRFAAELDFDLHKSVYEATVANCNLLFDGHLEEIREEFERIVVASHAGKGLNMMADSGLMAAVVGEEVFRKMNARERKTFTELCEGIDKTKQVRTRRLGLFYTCFDKKKGLAAIDRLVYDAETLQHLTDAMCELLNIQFLFDPKAFKNFLVKVGMDRYNYLHNLAKAQRIVYDQPATKIESRNHYMREIINNNEPVFPEDLIIDANDIMEAGITDDPAKAENLLVMLTDVVHLDVRNNVRDYLLKKARQFNRSKFAASTRGVKWLK
ncbi:MAG TPA: hypothetical protein VJY37_03940 [Anaerovoracaceae bacterium]|nr:hypothetical protein [Anaerovoracaceae bacterium]